MEPAAFPVRRRNHTLIWSTKSARTAERGVNMMKTLRSASIKKPMSQLTKALTWRD